ncbi:MAG: hypothetical protein HYW01_02625 [Deltaproteobacteria bacterium]|nr:hypothetical protein [Deltaproteobacteria bacterium]
MVQYILRRDFHFALIIFCLLFIACAPTNVILYKQSDGKIGRYDVIEIPNFTKTDAEWVPYDSYTQIPDMLAEKLRTTNEFREIRRSEYNTPTQERVLLVKGTVTGYTRGCKYCEWLIRVNDKGKGSVSVWVRLIDKTTGDALTDAGIEGRAVKPGYGKSRYVRIVDEIEHLIENVNKGKS